MVDGPFTRSEAAERCRCKPEELCPGPLAGIDESDKIRTIYDGSKRTSRLTRRRRPPHRWLETASMPSTGLGQRRTILIYSEPHPWEPRDVHQPAQGQSPGAEGPERDPHSTSLPPGAEGPDRGRRMMRPACCWLQTAGPGGHLHQQGGGTSPGPDSMGYFGVSLDKTFPPALLELEEGLHHFGQATEAGSCSGHPSGEALQPEVPTGISICSHTSMDGGI